MGEVFLHLSLSQKYVSHLTLMILGFLVIHIFINVESTDKINPALMAGVAQWIEHRLANQKVVSSIPSLGHTPWLRARSPLKGVQEANTH